MDNKEIIQKLKESSPDGRISCSEARKLAGDLNIELGMMGKLCDEAGIKIFGCELGCF